MVVNPGRKHLTRLAASSPHRSNGTASDRRRQQDTCFRALPTRLCDVEEPVIFHSVVSAEDNIQPDAAHPVKGWACTRPAKSCRHPFSWREASVRESEDSRLSWSGSSKHRLGQRASLRGEVFANRGRRPSATASPWRSRAEPICRSLSLAD